jgi:hypothetical protein
MVRPEGQNAYRPFVGSVGCVVAHETLAAARNALKVVRAEFANAYIQTWKPEETAYPEVPVIEIKPGGSSTEDTAR